MNDYHVKKQSIFFEELQSRRCTKRYIVDGNVGLTLILVISGCSDVHISVALADRGASAKIIGFVLGDHSNEIKLTTDQNHIRPQTSSDLLVKSVMQDESSFTYDGSIYVHKDSQQADAYQRNENLLLSEHSKAVCRPMLEIQANDVRCTHGATTSALSDDEVWYLQTRGIDKRNGEKLIVNGFFERAILRIPDTIMQDTIRAKICQKI